MLTDHGTVWAGTSLGVRRINPQTDADVAYEELGDTDMLLPVEDGRMWAVSKRGLFYFDGNHWIKPEMDTTDKYFYQLGIDQAGDLRALSSAGRYPESYHYSGHTPPLISIKGPANASVDSNPTVCTQWQTITTGSYIHRSPAECDALNQARWKIYRELTQDYPVMAIAADQSVWWAARNTLGHLSDTQSSSYALPVGQIYALASDPERGVWIGTDRGLAYFDDSTLRWVSLGLEQCALQGVPKDIAVDAHGVAWLLTTNGEVLRFAPGDRNWTAVTEFRTTAQGRPVQALVAAPTGGIWISHGYDLQYFDGNTLIQSTTVPIYTYGVHNLFVDPAGIVWNLGECERYQFNPNTDQWSGYDLCNLHKSSDLTAPVMVRDGSFYSLDSDGLIAYPPF
ncbi:MAG TPA: hypothetical protein VMP08_15805, partial [Anaerolineae bacterium]|nr:hypothetical protein [Anaerolineae bacterium]